MKNGVICFFINSAPRVMVIKMLVMAHFCISADDSKILVTVWAKYISASERSYWVISENGMVNLIWS